NSSSNLRGDFLLFTILKSPFKICVYLFKSISKNVSTLLGYMQLEEVLCGFPRKTAIDSIIKNKMIQEDTSECKKKGKFPDY
ncbi:hypothetical protein, partial [Enterococcus faecalis]|uniref:hypothetical protein n=1 Tax=Enterococcus faecalis TaxID=1351 RepID=UPI002DBF6FB8